MFTKHITDKELVFREYKEFSELSKTNNPILKKSVPDRQIHSQKVG